MFQVHGWLEHSSAQVYDFIIFRGQDIKDLTVLESGKQPGVAACRQTDGLLCSRPRQAAVSATDG